MHTGIRMDLNELRARWPELDLGSGSHANMPEGVEQAIRGYIERPGNLDGRGIKSRVVAEVRRTLRHLKSAAKRATRVGAPEARMARKLLKSLHHTRDFEALSKRARTFAGALQRIGKQKAKRTAVCEVKSICLGAMDTLGELRLERVVSVADLQAIGRQLHLCVAHNNRVGRNYQRFLRKKEVEFWQLRAQAPLALLAITRANDGEQGRIFECETARESSVEWPRSILLRAARMLEATGDEIAEFEQAGAFWALSQPLPPTKTIVIGEARYRVWRFSDELIIQSIMEDSGERRVGWSRFVRKAVRPWFTEVRGQALRARREERAAQEAPSGFTDWSAWSPSCVSAGALCDEQLQALMLASPEMYTLLASTTQPA